MKTLVGMLFLGFFLYWESQSFEDGKARYFFVVLVVIGIMASIVQSIYFYNSFCVERDKERLKSLIARKKFSAEIWAGIALFSFFIVFFQFGHDIDINNIDARFNSINQASSAVSEVLGPDYCSSKKYRKLTCDMFHEGMFKLQQALFTRNEYVYAMQTDMIKLQLKQAEQDIGGGDQVKFEEAISMFDEAKVSDEFESTIIRQFLLSILLLASTSAVFRKVSIAAYDASILKKPICEWLLGRPVEK